MFRFDYFGTGDSGGCFKQARMERWEKDVECALAEFREISGVDRFVFLGIRAGANIAYRAARGSRAKVGTILCDPVFDTEENIEKLLSMHEQMLVDRDRFTEPRNSSSRAGEILGFEYTHALLEDLHQITIDNWLVSNCHVLLSSEIMSHLTEPEISNVIEIGENFYWNRYEYIETALVSPELIKQVKFLIEDFPSQ